MTTPRNIEYQRETFARGFSILFVELQIIFAEAKQFGGISPIGKLVLAHDIFMFPLMAINIAVFYHNKRFGIGIQRCVLIMRNIISISSPIRRRGFRIGKRGWDYKGARFAIKSHLPDKGTNVLGKLLYTDFIEMYTFSS